MLGLLIRHGQCDAIGQWLAGRREGVPLNAAGQREALALSDALRWLPITAVYSSPLDRAIGTARPLAGDHGLTLRRCDELTDVDFGAWTGASLQELAHVPEWQAFNRDRARACPPGGESLADVQRRVVALLVGLSRQHAAETVVLVTHAEPIRCVIAAFERRSLDDVAGVEISPAHVSTVGLGPNLQRVLSINMRPDAAAV